jgi:hypothetical protein
MRNDRGVYARSGQKTDANKFPSAASAKCSAAHNAPPMKTTIGITLSCKRNVKRRYRSVKTSKATVR